MNTFIPLTCKNLYCSMVRSINHIISIYCIMLYAPSQFDVLRYCIWWICTTQLTWMWNWYHREKPNMCNKCVNNPMTPYRVHMLHHGCSSISHLSWIENNNIQCNGNSITCLHESQRENIQCPYVSRCNAVCMLFRTWQSVDYSYQL